MIECVVKVFLFLDYKFNLNVFNCRDFKISFMFGKYVIFDIYSYFIVQGICVFVVIEWGLKVCQMYFRVYQVVCKLSFCE